MDVSLRTFVFIDSLQPQLASYLATSSQGFLPVPGDACVWIEVAPGMAVHRLSDIALKETNVHLGEQVVERDGAGIPRRRQLEVRQVVRDRGVQVDEPVVALRAVNSLEEAMFWERMREGYNQLRRDPDAWGEHVAETRMYDSTMADGFDDELI